MRPSPFPPFCGRVTRQQRMYNFRREVLDLCNVSGFEHQPRSQGLFPEIGTRPWERGCLNTFSLEKNASTTGTLISTLGAAFYVDKQLMFKLFTCR